MSRKASRDPEQKNLVLIVAGEASADLHGANLIGAMKKQSPNVHFWGIGGRRMEKAGARILIPSSDMAVVGLTEIFSKARTIIRAYNRLKSIIKTFRPGLIILIDYPDFNIALARTANKCGVPVLYYISPQVWAWRRGRIKKIARRVDRMAVIFPFEQSLYRGQSVSVDYVGHPILDEYYKNESNGGRPRTAEPSPSGSGPVLGLLPGSRLDEVKNLLPVMVGAAENLARHYPDLRGVIPVAPTIPADLVRSMTDRTSVKIELSQDNIYKSMTHCDLAIVASGTATLEIAMMTIPMIIVYRVSALSFWIGKRIIKVPHISLVNLVAGAGIVPELIQKDATSQKISDEAHSILRGGRRRENMIQDLIRVRRTLGKGGASKRTASIALEMMSDQ
jgi:lipid-A-disaccharide synthase